MVTTKFISPLEKVFRDTEPMITNFEKRAYKNQDYCFQLCITSTVFRNLYVKIESDVLDFVEVRSVKYVPALMADYLNPDDYRIFTEKTSTYYPDLLEPVAPFIQVVAGCWASLFITVKAGCPVGEHTIRFMMGDYYYQPELILSDNTFNFSVSDKELEKCDIPVTCWNYYDCFAQAYHKKLFSESYYRILKKYFTNAVSNGINTVFVPLFSHPQRDQAGVTPPVVQLVDVEENNGKYIFDFTKLNRFLALAKKCGFTYYETSHVASQMGAKHCPKIVGKIDGKEGVLFDCNTPCSSPKYIAFLRELFTGVQKVFENLDIMDKCYFHISDEPLVDSLENFRTIGEAFREILPKGKLIDAVNDIRFAEMGILDYPVVGTNHADEFFEKKIPIWLYYCCDQSGDYLSNRFFNFPLLRTRVIGLQLYLTGAKGFLHWAYNYWQEVSTKEYLDPKLVSDGGGWLPAGDCYLVYPGKNGPDTSLREKAFAAGICDYRALKTLENKKGKEFVLNLLEKYGFKGLRTYTHDENRFTEFWQYVQTLIEGN